VHWTLEMLIRGVRDLQTFFPGLSAGIGWLRAASHPAFNQSPPQSHSPQG